MCITPKFKVVPGTKSWLSNPDNERNWKTPQSSKQNTPNIKDCIFTIPEPISPPISPIRDIPRDTTICQMSVAVLTLRMNSLSMLAQYMELFPPVISVTVSATTLAT